MVALYAQYNTLTVAVVPVVSIRGRIPGVLFNRSRFGMHAVHLTSEVIHRGKIECRGSELNVTSTKACPTESRRVDPPDEVEVIHVLDRSEIRSLEIG
jgi:hypothetical protein